jgi:glutaryl-CoA dehydrogenase
MYSIKFLHDISFGDQQMSNQHKSIAFQWDDPLLLEHQLDDEERMVRDSARAYCQEQLAPRVLDAFRREHTDPAIFREMGALGLLGVTSPEAYGRAGSNNVCYGLVAREVERVDSGYRSMMSVQSSLVMVPINEFGTDATKQKYLTNLDVVNTYEGTHDVHALILGRAITGIAAF